MQNFTQKYPIGTNIGTLDFKITISGNEIEITIINNLNMDTNTVFLTILIFYIIFFVILILTFIILEKIHNNNQKILVNEIQIKLNEYYQKSLDHMTSLSNIVDCSSKFSQLTSETLGEILKTFSSEYYVPTLLTHNIHIGLPEFEISFKTPEDGYLYLKTDYCEVNAEDKINLTVKNELTNLFIAKDTKVEIKNIKNPNAIQFHKKIDKIQNTKNNK